MARSKAPKKREEPEITDRELELLRKIKYDTGLLRSPMVFYPMLDALQELLTHLGRPKMGEKLRDV